jgi:hypothetical protein
MIAKCGMYGYLAYSSYKSDETKAAIVSGLVFIMSSASLLLGSTIDLIFKRPREYLK